MAAPSAVLREWNVGARILDLCLNRKGNVVAARLEDGAIAFVHAEDSGEAPLVLPVDGKGLVALVPDSDDHAFLACGASGGLYILEKAVAAPTLIAEKKGMKTACALNSGLRAFASDSTVYFLNEEASEDCVPWTTPCPIEALAFEPGTRTLAAAQGSGVEMFSIMVGKKTSIKTPQLLFDLLWGMEGQTLFAAGKESVFRLNEKTATEIWRAPTPSRLGGFTARQTHLALSGGSRGVLLALKDSKPLFLGGADTRHITHIAPHPTEPFVAMGYDDGLIVFSPLDGRTDILVHAPVAPQGSGVAGLVWNGEGDTLVAALESGWVMLLTQKSVRAAVKARLN